MTALSFLPVVLSFLLMAVHFFRSGELLWVAVCLLLNGLLLVRRAWAARLMQLALLLGAVEWMRTGFHLAEARRTFGEPYARLVIILGAVALFTALAALLFQSRRLKVRFRIEGVAE
jgi:hypothetical protein